MRTSQGPHWIDSLIFLALMSGPPKFRDRDITDSLRGVIDPVVMMHVAVWGCGAFWVLVRVLPSLLRRGLLPSINQAQVIGWLLIAALSLSLWHSPGFLLTGFMLGQFVVMLSFAWVFADRFGPSTFLRHLFVGVCLLTLALLIAAALTPGLVIDPVITNQGAEPRFRGERIVGTGAVAVIGLVFCLSNVPRLRPSAFWGAVGLCAVLLATSRMRTAYVALLAYLPVGFVFGRGLRVRRVVPLLAALCVGLVAMDAFAPATDYIVRESNSIESMSDRIPLWDYLTTAVMEREPLIGFGYFAASRILAPEYNPGLGNAHSAFFEFLVGGGLLAAALYLALCVSLLWYGARLLRIASGQPEAVASVGLLLVVLVFGITSSEAANAGLVGFCFWSMTAILPTMCREAAAHRVVRTRHFRARRGAPTVPTVAEAPLQES